VLEHDDFVIASLVEEGVVARAVVDDAARVAASKQQGTLGYLVESGKVTVRQVALCRAMICEVPFVDLERYRVDIRNAALMPRGVAEGLTAFPLFAVDDVTTVAMANPLDLRAVDQVRAVLKTEIEPVLCEEESLSRLIERAYSLAGGQAGVSAAAAEKNEELTTGREPVVAAVNQILAQAVERGASDVHIGPDEGTLHLRYRIDGILQAQQGPSIGMHAGLVQRLKVMANLDLTQTRRPQDGKFRFSHRGRSVDVRVSIIPTVTGENVVIRLLSSAGNIKGFPELGLPADVLPRVTRLLEQPNGMLLVTGPTGSGKTTTLYTALKHLNSPERNIMTIEDPVEIRMPLIRQVQVNHEIGMGFAGALRSMLRQDPDVVLVGEIRDEETARIAVQAALTGHLVLSSLHTNDAPGAVARLRDLGCPGFAVNAAVLAVLAQRLARRVCADCSQPDDPEAGVLERFAGEAEGGKFVKGSGCLRCNNTGYRGRLGLYELLVMSRAMRRAIDANAGTAALREAAEADGMKPMWRDGLEKAMLGLTTLTEVLRVAAAAATDGGEHGGEISDDTMRQAA
jgi:type II secretory ATPase GspE/PulE/Tfp pilus assembly ATPase PilB-like protein